MDSIYPAWGLSFSYLNTAGVPPHPLLAGLVGRDIKSQKACIYTMYENIADAFFRPKGITLYAKEPHSVMKVVFFLSSSGILTWW